MIKLSTRYVLIALATLSLAACGGGGEAPAALGVGTPDISAAPAPAAEVALSPAMSPQRSSADAANLDELRAEEQRARDVYLTSLSGQ